MPLLEQIEVALARAAGQHVTAALEPDAAGVVDREPGVGPVELFLDDAVRALQGRQRDLIEVVVAGLEPAALEVMRTGIAMDRLDHRSATATI